MSSADARDWFTHVSGEWRAHAYREVYAVRSGGSMLAGNEDAGVDVSREMSEELGELVWEWGGSWEE